MFEAELRDFLSGQLDVIEGGLSLVDKERYIPNSLGTRGFIDILAQDKNGRWILLELKRSDASAREAIHEIYKYVEGVKSHLRARDDEIRTIIVSTEWKELLVPFSRFVHDTSISVKGMWATIDAAKRVHVTLIEPLPVTSGRILSPWHEINLYRSQQALRKGVKSYDASCSAKGIEDYVLVIMKAPKGFYEQSVVATANAINGIQGGDGQATDAEIADIARKMDRLDWMIYFVPQLLTADAYLKIIERTPELFEEAKEFQESMGEEEALCSLQEYALDAEPRVYRDRFEIGYAAKFRSKLLDEEGWTIREVIRRRAFARNSVLEDGTIINEIGGDAGTSGQRFKRSIQLNDKAAFTSSLNDSKDCLVNNQAWANQIAMQLDEARRDFPNGMADINVFSPSTGVFTIFFTTTRDDGVSYLPSYSIHISDEGLSQRMYVGELTEAKNEDVGPDTFARILQKYYQNDIGILVMNMTWGGYESRDAEILDDLNLDYTSFKCDIVGDERLFYRMTNNRWRRVSRVELFEPYNNYLARNIRLVTIIREKLLPRIGPGICDGSPAKPQLEELVNPELAAKGRYYIDPPGACDICQSPLSFEPFMSDAAVKEKGAWANMCADCTIYHAAGFGLGVGQLYRNEGDDRWLLVAGSNVDEEEE